MQADENATTAHEDGTIGDGILLSVNWTRNTTQWNSADLFQAMLTTNETSAFQNYTTKYGSIYNFSVYSFNEISPSQATTSAAFVNASVLNFTVNTTRDYLIVANGEVNCGASGTNAIRTRLMIDSSVAGETNFTFPQGSTVSNPIFPTFFVDNASLTVGPHQIYLQFASPSGATCYINNSEVFATPIYDFAANTSGVSTNGGASPNTFPVATVQLSVPNAGNYLVLASGTFYTGASLATANISMIYDGVKNDIFTPNLVATNFTYAHARIVSLGTGLHWINMTIHNTAGGTPLYFIRALLF